MSPFDNYIKSKKLPLGHYDRKKAEEALNKEYHCCSEENKKWMKKIPKKHQFLNKQQSINLIWKICNQLGIKCLKKVYFNSQELELYTVGHYNSFDKSIHLAYKETIPISLLIHELAHHVKSVEKISGTIHGEGFVWVQNFLFEVVEFLLGEVK